MLTKTITYTNYNDVEVTEKFYFNLTKAEITQMELSVAGGLSEILKKMVDGKDVPTIMETFKMLIHKSYGEKSDDGKYFRKSEEISNAFEQTEAYSELFIELMNDPKKAGEFLTAILPKEVQEQAKIEQAKLLEENN